MGLGGLRWLNGLRWLKGIRWLTIIQVQPPQIRVWKSVDDLKELLKILKNCWRYSWTVKIFNNCEDLHELLKIFKSLKVLRRFRGIEGVKCAANNLKTFDLYLLLSWHENSVKLCSLADLQTNADRQRDRGTDRQTDREIFAILKLLSELKINDYNQLNKMMIRLNTLTPFHRKMRRKLVNIARNL